ncbi:MULTISPECIES: peptidoglycan DD-metalloendopeptidase family protein [Kitasatospora]|uniref:Putative peptidase M23 family protein n=1 Tax=Kitasatospora setae (strain ATCC 33774 / DSM 43861 / JCM 3304 / KCC A-0304 / NBRC 14216 / KM-6054) TaxID=452652 RepID=E4NB61_KITSK|nr:MULTISPECIES: peptidoglycan DD-metalloendopeptidase family protein [Kitasatospora]BAJ28442.1 putative peptidase M23 family protein [Kitasatospora setae KM-6054]
MSAQGKHRKPRLATVVRIAIATGVAGAAIGLPATAASAHGTADHQDGGRSWANVSVDATPVADTAADSASSAAPAADQTYRVVSGDTLSKIATAKNVDGGWEKLYQDNRSVIGGNPDLIRPGQQLTLGGQAAAASAPASTSSDTAAAAAPKTSTGTAAKTQAQTKTQTQVQTQTKTQTKTQTQTQKSTSSSSSAASSSSSAATASSGYVAPAPGSVTTGYKVAGSNWSSGYHTGIDFPVSTGTSLKAIAGGTVVSAGNGGAYGNQVVIKLADGKYAQYAHLSSISVSAGQAVTAGQQIGLSGATGNVTGPHLHFEIRTTPDYGSDIDPVAYLAAHGVNV